VAVAAPRRATTNPRPASMVNALRCGGEVVAPDGRSARAAVSALSTTGAVGSDPPVSGVDDVLITAELASRPCRSPDYEAESRALGLLAQEMSAIPRGVSPCGTVMERNCVLLFNEAERFFPALRDVEPRIYENLLAPGHVRGKAVAPRGLPRGGAASPARSCLPKARRAWRAGCPGSTSSPSPGPKGNEPRRRCADHRV
jgi:hypothetical protein